MPEGPEVHTITDQLIPLCVGKQILNINYNELSRYAKIGVQNLNLISFPIVIEKVYAKGKKIFFQCANNISFVSFLGMEGKWSLSPFNHSGLWINLGKSCGRI